MAISLPQLICHELQTGVDENGAGLCSSGGNAEKVLLETLHDAVARNRAAGKDMQDLAATSLTSHRCMTAYSLYAKTLQEEVQTAGIEDIGSMDDAAKFAEYASRIWCLIHNMSINRIWKPGFGYLDFYRNWQEGSLLSSAHEVHGICEASLGQLPPAPITLVEDVAAVLDPLTQLYTSITYCIQQQENIAIQSQVQLVASDWTEWLSKSSDCYEYIVGLAKLGRVGTLSKALYLIFIFTSLSGCFSLQGPCATLLRTLVELCQEYDGFYDDMTQNSNNVYARFSIWRTKIKEVYSSVHIVEDSNVSHNQLKQEVDSTPLSSLMNASILVLDILSVSEALVDHNTLQWHEFLAMYCSYVEPGMLEGRMSKILSGSDSLFQHLRMQESDMCELPEEEKLIIMVLRGEILNVINHMSGFGVPGLVPHLLEIISSSLVGNPEHEIHNVRDRSFSSYSSDLMTVTPHHWQKAFDYALWAGQEGLPILLNSLPHLQLNSNGIDCLTSMYELWKPLDTDGLIRTAIQDCVCLHGHTLFRRGLIVEGMRRLLQAADYCSLEQYLIDIIHTWSLRVLRSEKKPGLGERDWVCIISILFHCIINSIICLHKGHH